jgi:integrase/recombinase XerD
MKINREGQATPLDRDRYLRIRRSTPNDLHRCLLDIAYYTGLRWATILRLRWIDVFDPDGNPRDVILCPKETTKNKTTHEIPMHEDLKIMLSSMPISPDRELIFPFSISAADKQFRRAIRKAKLSGLGISRHSTRRGFITQLHSQGVGIKTIQKLTGHKSLASLQVYIEITDVELKSAIGAIGR